MKIRSYIYKALLAAAILLLSPAPKTAYAQDITTGLIGHWTLDEASGTLKDSSSYGNDGTASGGPLYAQAGKIGKAMKFDGVDDLVSMGDIDAAENTNQMTWSLWVKDDFDGSWDCWLCKLDGSMQVDYAWGILELFNGHWGTQNDIQVYIATGGSDTSTFASTDSEPLIDNEWNHVVVVFDGTQTGDANRLNIYVNGIQLTVKFNNTIPASLRNSNMPVTIGSDANFHNKTDAYIDDVRIYNRALTAEDVAALYDNWHPGKIRYNTNWRAAEYYDGIGWNAMGPPQYVPNAVTFDGTNDYLTHNAAIGANSKLVTGSFWFRRAGGHGARRYIYRVNGGTTYNDTNARFLIEFDASNRIHLFGRLDTSNIVLNATSAATFGSSDTNWHHVMFSIDLANASNRHLYIDGAADSATWSTYANNNINFAVGTPRLGVGADFAGGSRFNGDLADFYLDVGTYTDLSDAGNRRKFYDNGPVYLGANGGRPTGSPPDIFLSGSTDTWHTNKGTGGGFTENGTLRDAATDPGGPDLDINLSSGLIGHWKLDETSGTLADSSGNGNDGTADGSLEYSSTGMLGYAMGFDGDDRISIANESNFDFERTDPFTLAAWVYYDLTASHQAIFGKSGQQVGSNYPGWTLEIDDNKGIMFDLVSNTGSGCWTGGNCIRIATGLNTLPTAGWYHIAATYDGSSSANGVKIYVNGAAVGMNVQEDALASSMLNDSALTLGANSDFTRPFSGRLDDMRVYNRALSSTEIKMLSRGACDNPVRITGSIIYNTSEDVMQYCDGEDWIAMGPPGDGGAGCSNPSGNIGSLVFQSTRRIMQYCEGSDWIAVGQRSAPVNGLVAWWKLDETSGDAMDSTGNGNTLTVINTPTWQPSGGVMNGALQFSAASSESAETTNPAPLRFGANSWTISTWVNLSALPSAGNYYGIFTNSVADGDSNYGLGVINAAFGFCTGNGVDFWLWFNDNGGTNYRVCSNTTVNTSTWYHLAGVWDASTGKMYLYIDGSLVGSSTPGGTPTTEAGGSMALGVDSCCGVYMNGSLDDARVYNRALSPKEIADLYLATGGTF